MVATYVVIGFTSAWPAVPGAVFPGAEGIAGPGAIVADVDYISSAVFYVFNVDHGFSLRYLISPAPPTKLVDRRQQ